MAFRTQKISQMTPKGADLEATDLIEVSTIESGSYVTRSITGQELIDAIPPTTIEWGDIGGTLSDQTDLQSALDAKVPTSRTLTINGVTQDLSANRTFTISTGITIGSTAIASGVVGRVLFEGTGNVVQQSSSLAYDDTLKTFTLIGPIGSVFQHTALTNYNGFGGFQLNVADGTERAFVKLQPNSGEFKIGTTSTGGYFTTIHSGGSEAMRIFASTRNIGINTTTDAGFRLDVNGTARTSQLHTFSQGTYLDALTTSSFHSVDTGTGTYGGVSLKNSINNYNGLIYTGRSGASNSIVFEHTTYSGTPSANGSQIFSQTSTTFGKFNNGTYGHTLYIHQRLGSAISYPLVISNGINSTNSGVGILMQTSDSTGAATINHASITSVKQNLATSTVTSDLRFSTITDSANTLSEKMRISNSGNLLINTTTDAGFRLDVNGTARVSGAATLAGTNTLSGTTNVSGLSSNWICQYPSNATVKPLSFSAQSGGATSNNVAIQFGFNFRESGGLFTQDIFQNILYDNTTNNVVTGFEWYTHQTQAGSNPSVLAMALRGKTLSIGTNTPNASAVLQADSTTQGFLPPRMTTTQKNAIATPAAGLMVYDTTLNVISYYNGTMWI